MRVIRYYYSFEIIFGVTITLIGFANPNSGPEILFSGSNQSLIQLYLFDLDPDSDLTKI